MATAQYQEYTTKMLAYFQGGEIRGIEAAIDSWSRQAEEKPYSAKFLHF